MRGYAQRRTSHRKSESDSAKEVVRLKEALKESRAAETESRHRAEQVALAAAVLILRSSTGPARPRLRRGLHSYGLSSGFDCTLTICDA